MHWARPDSSIRARLYSDRVAVVACGLPALRIACFLLGAGHRCCTNSRPGIATAERTNGCLLSPAGVLCGRHVRTRKYDACPRKQNTVPQSKKKKIQGENPASHFDHVPRVHQINVSILPQCQTSRKYPCPPWNQAFCAMPISLLPSPPIARRSMPVPVVDPGPRSKPPNGKFWCGRRGGSRWRCVAVRPLKADCLPKHARALRPK